MAVEGENELKYYDTTKLCEVKQNELRDRRSFVWQESKAVEDERISGEGGCHPTVVFRAYHCTESDQMKIAENGNTFRRSVTFFLKSFESFTSRELDTLIIFGLLKKFF